MSKLHIIRMGYHGSENLKSGRLLEPLVKDWFSSIVFNITYRLLVFPTHYFYTTARGFIETRDAHLKL